MVLCAIAAAVAVVAAQTRTIDDFFREFSEEWVRMNRAKAAMKNRFSERAFHNAVLAPGTVPLDLLKQEVNRYIRAVNQ